MSPDRRLVPEMEEFRDELARLAAREAEGAPDTAASGRRRRRPGRRPLAVALAGLVVGAGAVATATTLISTGKPVGDAAHLPAYRPGTTAPTVVVRAPDRAVGAAWGVAVYETAAGKHCVLGGQLRGTKLGTVIGGTFRPYDSTRTGPCSDLPPDRLVSGVLTVASEPVRTLVFGRVGTRVAGVRVTVEGKTYRARAGVGGAFLFVLDGRVLSNQIRLALVPR